MTVRRLPGAGGIALAAETWGDEGCPTVVLLHGGGQTRHAWSRSAPMLAAEGFHVVAPDLRGHGESDWSPDGGYGLERFAADVRALAAALPAAPILVGASLGGMSALLACGEPPAVAARALVLVDVAHRAAPEGVARIVAFMAARPEGFTSVDEAAAAVAAYLGNRPRPESPDGLVHNLRQRGGRWFWHWDPRLLERFAAGVGKPAGAERYVAAARALAAPLLVVRGARSDVISPEIAAELLAYVPAARLIDVGGAGHMVAGDRNDPFVDAILPFLREVTAG
jgi:pimeloyl-ACP methyl ester carboxylesterase